MTERAPGRPQTSVAAGGGDQVGDPVPGDEGRVDPLDDDHAGAGPRGEGGRDGRGDGVEAGAQAGDHLGRPPGHAERVADGEHRAEHVVQRRRVQGEHVGGAAEVGQRLVDHVGGQRADPAQVLGEHEVGVEAAQGALVQRVEVLARRGPGTHRGVDLGRASCRRCRCPRRRPRPGCARRPGRRTRRSRRPAGRRRRGRGRSRSPTAAGTPPAGARPASSGPRRRRHRSQRDSGGGGGGRGDGIRAG